MTLFTKLTSRKSADFSSEKAVEGAVSEELQRMELEAESRRDGIRIIGDCLKSFVSALEKISPQATGLSKALVQQGKFYQEKTDYARLMVAVGQAMNIVGSELHGQAQKMIKGLVGRMDELERAAAEYEQMREKVQIRRAALDDRRSKLAKNKKKLELEEQVRGAELIYQESIEGLTEAMSALAKKEESLLESAIRAFAQDQSDSFQRIVEAFHTGETSASDERKDTPKRTLPLIPMARSLEQPSLPRAKELEEQPTNPAASNLAAILVENRSQPNQQVALPSRSQSSSLSSVTNNSPISHDAENDKSHGKGDPPVEDKGPIVQENANERGEDETIVDSLPCSVKAIFTFEGQDDELSFEKGQTITLLKRLDNGWCLGELDGEQGVFPGNYVRGIDTKEDLLSPKPRTSMVTEEPQSGTIAKPSASGTVNLDFDATPQPAADKSSSLNSPGVPETHRSMAAAAAIGTKAAFSYLPANGQFSFVPKAGQKTAGKADVTEEPVSQPSVPACRECGCSDYCANVFKRDQCNNCFHAH